MLQIYCKKFTFAEQINKKSSRTMAYKINPDLCVACGTCAGECPVGAIHEGDPAYTIDPEACAGCGTCAGVCPMGAIEGE